MGKVFYRERSDLQSSGASIEEDGPIDGERVVYMTVGEGAACAWIYTEVVSGCELSSCERRRSHVWLVWGFFNGPHGICYSTHHFKIHMIVHQFICSKV